MLGAWMTLIVCLLTLVILTKKAEELILMDNPSILNFSKPMSDQDRQDLVPIHFSEKNFIFGIQVLGVNPSTETVGQRGLPLDIGRFMVVLEQEGEKEEHELVDC